MDYQGIEKIVGTWKKTGMLEGVKDVTGCALCLQAQIKFSEQHDLDPKWRRFSIPILRRMFGSSRAISRNHFGVYGETAWPTLLVFKAKFAPPESGTGRGDKFSDLDAEAEYAAKLTETLIRELDEAFGDKREAEVNFKGLGLMGDGSVVMYYS
jgi:hypothetical protein